MKRFATILAGLLMLCAARAQYSIDWFTIDGGGGTSTGDVYSVSGTIGQPDAGTMSGGNYTLVGGFWALPTAVQDTNGPLLKIVAAGVSQATVSWTPPTPGFVLQFTPTLTPPNWTNSLSGATNPVTVTVGNPSGFYRLIKP
jgi:hypothetical protein